ncbi:adenosylmethionine--8-amino-7-oxononanoate transaminase [Wolinella succinogenes]|uniref:Adenosylmethionine-8-amino-7-oxononanoate aminotransferase n=1 Tax=Wolinella succinogenes (strain ATCC 29543 / DSM 1740 / CCUG 13145 / JCM 31913 / LMG 7466 / NCTC 11488 / FDC 602W) TaxID=273121 RepID=Q7MAH9_WOLSU|nr:adenosylmethionine--8-amino-7-oxononanoate transaminase [Wolinella succinogenes]CAE09391.1 OXONONANOATE AMINOTRANSFERASE [Wolinella succinogenes]VEG81604.1 Adenosylmethionine-8-amino-7-oxononanoate aminotransferase [Wolinella succinogenes]HCZ18915.1 adenosylmethionine--8-amino-7-oxononanoate transaminase [Helicobacter sp.]
MDNKTLAQEDLRYLWHPCTQMKDHEQFPLIPIARGKGVYLYDFEGNAYIDGVSSWWVNLFGHSHDYINSQIVEQMGRLEHVILAGFTHEPIIKLSKRLVEMTPHGLEKCFYADNGSSAIEVALKMSFHRHKIEGKKRALFLSLSNSYHGETIGALSVGDVALYKETYGEILLATLQTPVPRDLTQEATQEALEALEVILENRGEEISAFVLEPLVQCAGGMHMYSADYVKGASQLCRARGIHLIFDEIAVGFGRTGTLLALEQCGVVPDFLCLSKGITGGYLPLSVVMMSQETYDCFYAPYHENRAFLHSHSYTGNALACAAANATLDLLEDGSVLKNNRLLGERIDTHLKRLALHPRIGNARRTGMIAALDLLGFDPKERVGLRVYSEALKRGILLRPLGNVIYFMPPYVITLTEIDQVFEALEEVLGRIL